MVRIRLQESAKLNESKAYTIPGIKKAIINVYDSDIKAPSDQGDAPIVAHWMTNDADFTFSNLVKGTYTVDTKYEGKHYNMKIEITNVDVNLDNSSVEVRISFKHK